MCRSTGSGILHWPDRTLLLPSILLRCVDINPGGNWTVRSVVERARGGERTRDRCVGALNNSLRCRDVASSDISIPGEDLFCGNFS
jgi:hypothetical protein